VVARRVNLGKGANMHRVVAGCAAFNLADCTMQPELQATYRNYWQWARSYLLGAGSTATDVLQLGMEPELVERQGRILILSYQMVIERNKKSLDQFCPRRAGYLDLWYFSFTSCHLYCMLHILFNLGIRCSCLLQPIKGTSILHVLT
jgi:hypothetical protein